MEKQGSASAFAPRRERGIDSFRRGIRRGLKRGKGKGAARSILRGVLIAASITIIGVAGFALILNWWNASDRAITAINQVVKFVSILAGVASAMDEKAGALRGSVVGLLYMALGIFCYSFLMGQSVNPTAYLADLGLGVAAGGLFAMILMTGREAS